MVARFLRINAITDAERHKMLPRLREAITQSGGWILNFQMFSDVSICIQFEIPGGCVGDLYESLTRTCVRLSGESREMLLNDEWRQSSGRADGVWGTLQISFINRRA